MPKFQIHIISIRSNEALLIRTIRLVTNLGAFDSAVVVAYLRVGETSLKKNRTPCILMAGVSGEVAEHAANLLQEAGAEFVVEASSLESPTVLLRRPIGGTDGIGSSAPSQSKFLKSH
jgi:hypothetical protein